MARHTPFSFARWCSLLLVLILCQEVFHVEARHLREDSKIHRHHHHHHHHETGVSVGRSFGGGEGRSKKMTGKVEDVADFPSTEPGHSPGVGHSINN
ncbi:hypothetical protein ACJRO7_034522 [Eucalyptus globulus]|uniref:Uncharacterized protein n=1 Tax=Eucalyptus globulus TaxID=34317 RepID=A0ABD3J6V4_EUCGL